MKNFSSVRSDFTSLAASMLFATLDGFAQTLNIKELKAKNFLNGKVSPHFFFSFVFWFARCDNFLFVLILGLFSHDCFKVGNENINLLRVCEQKFSALFQMNFTLSVFSQTQNVAHCAHAVQCAVFLIIFPSSSLFSCTWRWMI